VREIEEGAEDTPGHEQSVTDRIVVAKRAWFDI